MNDTPQQLAAKTDDCRHEALTWLEDFGDDLYSYARARVGHQATAEDLVQETLLAALTTYDQFRHDASTKTWLFGILRRKVIDHYRRQARQRRTRDGLPNSSPGAVDSNCGPFSMHDWRPQADEQFESQEFRQAFDDCFGKLSPLLGEAFVLRVMDELETSEVCKILGVTSNNLMVRLHRARIALRDCLEKNWFQKEE